MDEHCQIDTDIASIVSDIDKMVRNRSEADRSLILGKIMQAVSDGPPDAYSDGTIEGLHVWDLLSASTYSKVQFIINDHGTAGAIAWEERRLGLFETILSVDDNDLLARYSTVSMELAFALNRAACRSSCVRAWIDRVFVRFDADGYRRMDLATAYDKRRARNATKLSMLRLRNVEGLDVKAISDRFLMSTNTVRNHLAHARELLARRTRLPDPDCHSSEHSYN